MSISLCTASAVSSPSKFFVSLKNLKLRYHIYGRGHEFSVEFTGGGSVITAAFVSVCWLSKASRLSWTSVMPFVRSLGTSVQQNRSTNSRYEGMRALWDCNRCIVVDVFCNCEACSLDAPGVVTPDTAPDISEPN